MGTVPKTSRFVCRRCGACCRIKEGIVRVSAEESAMTDGKPDASKMKPICFDSCQHAYRLMGEVVDKAFSCGKELM